MNLVPEEIKSEHLNMRKEFFKNLINYCMGQREYYTPNDLDQFRKNLATLEDLTR